MAYKKGLNREYFEMKYRDKGGIKQLEKMIQDGLSCGKIGKHFGLSRARIHQISTAIKNKRYAIYNKGVSYPQENIKKP